VACLSQRQFYFFASPNNSMPIQVVIQCAARKTACELIPVSFRNSCVPPPTPRVPLLVNRPAAATVEGGDTLSFSLNGKMYAITSTSPIPPVRGSPWVGAP
jgi:hypothetical protein